MALFVGSIDLFAEENLVALTKWGLELLNKLSERVLGSVQLILDEEYLSVDVLTKVKSGLTSLFALLFLLQLIFFDLQLIS